MDDGMEKVREINSGFSENHVFHGYGFSFFKQLPSLFL